MKNNNAMPLSVISLVISAVHFIAAFIMTARLPETVPTHFDVNWVCDDVGSRWTLLIAAVLPVIAGIVSVIYAAKSRAKTKRITSIVMLVMVLYLAALFWMIYPISASGASLGDKIESQALPTLMPLLYAGMFIVIGNYLPVIPPNNMLGLRVSWTLGNEQCWRVTHRFAGRLWVITGLLMFAVIFIVLAVGGEVGKLWFYILLFEMIAVNICVPCVYAYIHKDDGKENEQHA